MLQVAKIRPRDPDAQKKLKECEKAVQKLRFEEAIAQEEQEHPSVAETIDLSSMGKTSPHLSKRLARQSSEPDGILKFADA
jgi:serine/threonine-protein phosphatase 5